MAIKKSGGLGRGLGSILPDIDLEVAQKGNTVAASISTIPLDKITANPFQPRKEFSDEALEDTAARSHHSGDCAQNA